jgi:hypothetical protein
VGAVVAAAVKALDLKAAQCFLGGGGSSGHSRTGAEDQ